MEQESLEPVAELAPEELELVAGGSAPHTGIGRAAG